MSVRKQFGLVLFGCNCTPMLMHDGHSNIYFVEFGSDGGEVIWHMFLDVLWLSSENLPEGRRLLALPQRCNLCLPLALILIYLFSKQPATTQHHISMHRIEQNPEPVAAQVADLPGLGGAAQSGVGPSPDEDLRAGVHQEDKAAETQMLWMHADRHTAVRVSVCVRRTEDRGTRTLQGPSPA